MNNKKVASLLVIGGLLAGVTGSIGLAVHAQSTSVQSALSPAVSKQISSINDAKDVETIDKNEVGGPSEQQNTQAEYASLQAKATINAEQAKKIAETKVAGTATSLALEDENGTAVYAVTVGNQDIKVNAADGSIIKIEKSDAGEKGKDQEISDNSSSKNDGGDINDGGIDLVN